jgi:hypothetical protein
VTLAGARLIVAALLCCAAPKASAQSAAVPIVAVGDGRTFEAALSAAIRMAVESGAGATIAGAVASKGERITTDSVRSVSRGVVTRYVVVDSATTAAGAHVRILAMVSRIAERDAIGARGQRIAAPGALWNASATLDTDRRAGEGALLSEIFASIDRQPNAYSYSVETGPPVPSGTNLRMRLRVIRSPSAAYAALRERSFAILSAIAGPAGTRMTHLPMLTAEKTTVRSCVSHCAADERRILNPRAILDAPDSLGTIDPPVLTAPRTATFAALFPDLNTAGGFVVAYTDSTKKRQQLVHVRSTRGYLAVVDYLRATFDDARYRVELGGRRIDLTESFRTPLSGQPQPRFIVNAPPGSLPTELVQGFRPHLSGGPGAATTLGSPYVILAVPTADQERTDTALVDVWLTTAEVTRITSIGVEPIATTHRLSGAVPTPQQPEAVPLAVLDAVGRPPLLDGDGAISLAGAHASVVAVGSATVDAAAPAQACAVARLRAQRELIRFITGSHLEGRIGLSTSEARGGQVQELFREEITETVAGRLAGAALAAQWTVNAPSRCRVALWLADGLTVRRDSVGRSPR